MPQLTILGLIAGTITTLSFLPQVIKSWKSRRTKDISLPMYLLLLLGIFLWLVYGFSIMDLPILFANGATFVLILVVLYLKLKHG